MKAELVYYQLKYCCVHGGKKFTPREKSNIVRKLYLWLLIIINLHFMYLRTFKKDCQYHISLNVDKFGSSLEVTSICTEHNHDVSKVKV